MSTSDLRYDRCADEFTDMIAVTLDAGIAGGCGYVALGTSFTFDGCEEIGFEAGRVETAIGDGELSLGIEPMARLAASFAGHAEMGSVIEDCELLLVGIRREGLPIDR